jgi:hypothetical protein
MQLEELRLDVEFGATINIRMALDNGLGITPKPCP